MISACCHGLCLKTVKQSKTFTINTKIMRKTFLFLSILGGALIVLFSCQKEAEKTNSNDQLTKKVNSWLDNQKSPSQPNKASNIDLLKDNLNFSEERFEELNQNERFLIIPVNEDYETKKNIDKKTVLVLLLVMDKSTNIIRGNLVLYSPEDNRRLNEIPNYTFFKMYNNQSLDCNGMFNFLSVTGRRMYQREYKDGKLHSFGYVKASNKPDEALNQAESRTETDCTYFFYILTWWVDGVPVYQETIFLGSICVGGCDDPMNQTLCPDNGGGSGGGGVGGEETCCIPDPNVQFSHEQTNINSDVCGFEGTNPITGNPTKSCTHTWIFDHWSALWFNWNFIAITNTNLEKEGQLWKFKTVTFQNVARDGQLPYCVSSECTVNSNNPSISADKTRAKLILNYTITNRVTCYSWWSPNSITSNISTDWPAPY